MARHLTLLAVLAAIVAVSSAQNCLSALPPAAEGEHCDSDVRRCQQHLYCNSRSVCEPRLAVGQFCEIVDECDSSLYGTEYCPCEMDASCRGVKGTALCVKNSGAGGKCDVTPGSPDPKCGGGLTCNPISKVCLGGGVNDACTLPTATPPISPCIAGLTCVNGKCTGIAEGGLCVLSTSTCAVGLICLPGADLLSNSTCQPLLGAGAECSPGQCQNGFYCARPNGATIEARICIQEGTVDVGGYCDYAGMCKDDMVCNAHRCSHNRPSECTSDATCSTLINGYTMDQLKYTCRCGGEEMLDSNAALVGSCTKVPCQEQLTAYMDCAVPNCQSKSVNPDFFTYDSCLSLNCKNQYLDYLKCSPANALSASILTIVVAFFLNKMLAQM